MEGYSIFGGLSSRDVLESYSTFGGCIKQGYAGELQHIRRLHQAEICWRATARLEVVSSRDMLESYSILGCCIKQKYAGELQHAWRLHQAGICI